MIKQLAILTALAAVLPVPAMAADDAPFATVSTLSEGQLSGITGQANLSQDIRANNTAEVSHNSIDGTSVTGGIAFDSQSFQNMNGLSVLSANTGNNVAINSSLNVNVGIQQ
jgi:hypothetical protein